MPIRKILKFGELTDKIETEEGDEEDAEETEDIFTVRFPQAGYIKNGQNVDTVKSVLSTGISNIRTNNIRPTLRGGVGIGKKPKLPTRTIKKV